MRYYIRLIFGLAGFLVLAAGTARLAVAQEVDFFLIGDGPVAIGVDPIPNTIYSANATDGSISIFDGTTGAVVQTVVLPSGSSPYRMAVDPVTGKVYISSPDTDLIHILQSGNLSTVTLPATTEPRAIAIAPASSLVLFAGEGVVGLIDSSTDTVLDVFAVPGLVGTQTEVAISPGSGVGYVADAANGKVYAVTPAGVTDLGALTGGSSPTHVAINPASSRVFIAATGPNVLYTYDETIPGFVDPPISLSGTPTAMAVNPVSDRVYVSSAGSPGKVDIIQGNSDPVAPAVVPTSPLDTQNDPVSVAVNPIGGVAFVLNNGSDSVTLIDKSDQLVALTPSISTAPDGADPNAIAVNPLTGLFYVVADGLSSGTLVRGSAVLIEETDITVGNSPIGIAVNSVTNKVYVGNLSDDTVSEYDPRQPLSATNPRLITSTINLNDEIGDGPIRLAVNELTNKIFVALQGDDAVAVIDGATGTHEKTISLGAGDRPRFLVVNQATNQVVVANRDSGSLGVIDGETLTLTADVPLGGAGTDPLIIELNPTTNLVYVGENGGDKVWELDPVSLNKRSWTVGAVVQGIAVDPVNNRVYAVSRANSELAMIDPAVNTVTIVGNSDDPAYEFDSPTRLAVSESTRRLYVVNASVTNPGVSVVEGVTLTPVGFVESQADPREVAINPTTGLVYVSTFNSKYIQVIREQTLASTEDDYPASPRFGVVNRATGSFFVSFFGGSEIAEFEIVEGDGNSIETTITPIAGNVTDVRSVNIALSASSFFQPVAPTVTNVFYQIDSAIGPWESIDGSAGNAQFDDLESGSHILFAFGTDGQEATSVNTGVGSSPVVGRLAAYSFVVAPKADLSLTLTSDPESPAVGDDVSFVVSVSNAGPETATGVEIVTTLPVGISYFSNNGGATFAPSGELSWRPRDLFPGQSASLEIVASINDMGSSGADYTVHSQVTRLDEQDPDSDPSSATFPTVDPAEDDEAALRLGFTIDLPPGTSSFSISEDIGTGLAIISYSDGVNPPTVFGPLDADLFGPLAVNPAPGDQVSFTVDPNHIPADGIQINGDGDETLTFTNPSPAVDSAQYEMIAAQRGSVNFDLGGPVSFIGVSSIDDETLVDDRGFGLADGGDTIILSENGAPTDESLLDTGLGTLISFKDPADLLSLTGSNGADDIEIQELELATASLDVDSGNGSDTIAVFAGAYPSTINGGNGSDQLTVSGPASSPIEYDVTGSGEGSVTFGTGESFQYQGIESVEDPLDVAVRTFVTSGSTGETITLSDDGVGADGISLLDTGLEHTISFRNPTTSLSLSGSAGADDIDFLGLDTQFLPAVLVIDGLGSEDDIFVSPVSNLPITVHGGAPTSLPGDFLDIEDAAGGVLTLGDPFADPTYGTYTFPGDLGTVTFDGIEATAESDLSISVTPATIYPADTTPIVFTVTNNGTNSATGVQVEVPAYLIANLAGLTSAVTGGSFASPIWTIGLLEPGAVVTLTLEGLLNSIVPASLTIEISNPPLNQNADNDSQAQTSSPGFTLPAKSHPKSILYTQYEFGGLNYDRALIGLFQGSPGLGGSVLCKIPQPPSGLFTAAGLGPVFRLCSDGLPFPLNINDLFEDESGTIWALTWGHAGLYRSEDKGITWTAASPEVRDGSSTWTNVYAMTQDQAGALFISTDNGTVFRSLNDGESWQQVGSVQGIASGTPWALEASLSTPGTVYAGSFGSGVFVTTNFGFAWEELPDNATLLAANAGHIFDLEISPIDTSVLFAATGRGVYRYDLDAPGWVFVGPEIELPEGSGTLVRPEMRSIDFDVTGATLGGASWGLGVFLNSAPLTTGVFAETAIREGYVSVIQAAPGGGFGLGLEGGGLQNIGTDAASSVFVESDASGSLPTGYALEQNYPNPFNPVTRIAFSLPESSATRLEVYDLLGRHVSTLVDGTMPAGNHQVHFDAGTLPSGTYLYTLTTGGRLFTKTLVLLK